MRLISRESTTLTLVCSTNFTKFSDPLMKAILTKLCVQHLVNTMHEEKYNNKRNKKLRDKFKIKRKINLKTNIKVKLTNPKKLKLS